jgi:HupE / UreJ protein
MIKDRGLIAYVNVSLVRVVLTSLIVLALLVVGVPAVYAHAFQPGYLEINAQADGTAQVLWKVPMASGRPLPMTPVLPVSCQALTPPATYVTSDAVLERWTVDCGAAGLAGQTIDIEGLEGTLTDVLVRLQFADGHITTKRLRPNDTSFVVPGTSSRLAVAQTYLQLGVEHILFGFDHLLFVLALLIIRVGVGQTVDQGAGGLGSRDGSDTSKALQKRRIWRLLTTLTAFTIAHSITLALAVQGYVNAPPAPIEAIIALSIVFVAAEIIYTLEGRPSLMERKPWLVAFIFGLLHGLGFAGALNEIGLPVDAIPLALFSFNVGVELGQVAFDAAVLALLWVAWRLRVWWPPWAWRVPAYAIGLVAAFWSFQRVAGFW